MVTYRTFLVHLPLAVLQWTVLTGTALTLGSVLRHHRTLRIQVSYRVGCLYAGR